MRRSCHGNCGQEKRENIDEIFLVVVGKSSDHGHNGGDNTVICCG